MQFNSHADNQDIVSDVKFWCGIPSTDTTTFPLTAIARNANFALDKIATIIMKSNRNWVWDDNNNSDFPITTFDLVDSQEDYGLAVTHLRITRVRLKDSAGEYYTLDPVNREDLTDGDLNAPKGLPTKFSLLGASIFLHPKPDTSMLTATNGAEIQFQRGASYFTSTDTTKTPGFASTYHRLIPLYIARDYCIANELPRLNAVQNEITRIENELGLFITERNVNKENNLSMSGISPF